MSVFNALSEGLGTTVLGMVTVFSALIILMLVLILMKTVFNKQKTSEKSQAEAVETKAVSYISTETSNEVLDEELIAVLTAAIAASLNTSTYNLQIKSYRRIETKSPVWNRAGIVETINSRL